MNDFFNFSEVGTKTSPLEELAKSFDVLPDRELNQSIGFFRCNPEDLCEGILKNKEDGLRREYEVESELRKKYPESEGYEIISEAYLRDKDGNIVCDPETGTARRIDFVVVKDGVVVESVEVTSMTADKSEQCAKEQRVRENGGNYIRTADGSLAEFPQDKQTKIERRA